MAWEPATPGSIPIALGKLKGVALLLATRWNPDRTRVGRQFPMSRHPLIPCVAPRPIACEPHILGAWPSQRDIRLDRWRGFGHDGRALDGRCSRDCHSGGVSIDHCGDRHCGRCRCGGGRHHLAIRHRWRWCRNHVRLRLGSATGQENDGAATCEDRSKLPPRADGG
jgi:hypothetical protein